MTRPVEEGSWRRPGLQGRAVGGDQRDAEYKVQDLKGKTKEEE